ncbi:hypothetical protein RUM43_001055 [Polyplax serrata]|uniref:Uncharacterized protein n=1 Tax=Polyplax serrata TaxID=468196 RepID=A0AAN8SH28_POLSC
MGYLVSPYPYPNGAGGPIPVSMRLWLKDKETKNKKRPIKHVIGVNNNKRLVPISPPPHIH